MPDTLFKPRKPGKVLAIKFLGYGATPSGLVVLHDERKFKMLAIVVETNETQAVNPGDVVLYKEGFADDFTTQEGDELCLIDETNIITVFENFFLQDEKQVTTQQSFSVAPNVL